jgi:hypothetical protein
MFVVAAQLRVPVIAVVLRKAYWLGAMAMAAGGLQAPLATAAWPSGEFGAMGLEGAVELGYRKSCRPRPRGRNAMHCAAASSPSQYEKGKAINMAATLEIDAVIDPAETRALGGLGARDGEDSARPCTLHRSVVSGHSRRPSRVATAARSSRHRQLGRISGLPVVHTRSRLTRSRASPIIDPCRSRRAQSGSASAAGRSSHGATTSIRAG